MRELFVYWKVRRELGAQAEQAAQALLRQLRQAHPALQCCLMRRAEAAETLTFMETYRCPLPEGVGMALQASIEEAATAALAVVGAPQRHAEVFERLDLPG